jgi:hypothetical protein
MGRRLRRTWLAEVLRWVRMLAFTLAFRAQLYINDEL